MSCTWLCKALWTQGAFKTLSPNKDVIDFYSSEIDTLSTASGDSMTLFGSGTIPFWNRLGQAA